MNTSGTGAGADAGGAGPENRPASRPQSSHRALHSAGASVVGSGGAGGATAQAAAKGASNLPVSADKSGAKRDGAQLRASTGDLPNPTASQAASAVDAAAAAVLDPPGASAGAVAGDEAQANGGGGAAAGAGAATAADNGTAAATAPDPAATAAPPSAAAVDASVQPPKPGAGRRRPQSGAGREAASTVAPAGRRGTGARPQSGRRAEPGPSPRQRPVQHAVKRARARNITTTSVDLLGEVDMQAGAQQSEETRAVLVAAFKHHFLFASLNDEDLVKAVAAMAREEFAAGSTIIQQSEPGSKFYVLEQGACEVVVNGEKVTDLEQGKGFGELALMYDSPRAATVRATQAAVVWSLDRDVFRAILATTASSRMAARCQFLANVPLLQPLSHQQISKIAEAMSVEEFGVGDYIIRQGERGDKFFVIWEGQVSCTKNVAADGSEQNEVMQLKKGDYFGEMALLTDEPRAANVIAANGPLKALALGRQDFDQLLGSLRDVLDRQMGIRVLKGVALLKDLNDGQLERLADALRREVFPKGTDIIKEGEEGDSFYIIKEGEVAVLKAGEKAEQQEVAKLPSGNFFGERALLKREKRGATVRATSDEVQCLRLHREDFDKLLGSLESLTQEMEAREREAGAAVAEQAPVDAVDKLDKSIKFEDLEQLATLGTGTFGRVRLVRHKPTQRVMALKSMYKAHIVATHQQRNIMNEKRCMAEAEHPFVLRLFSTFNHEHTIYMLLELVQGGELWSLLYERTECVPRTRLGGFEQGPAKFYAACVVDGLTHLHENGWAYRDLKPENLLLDGEGFLKIVDFGFAKRVPYTRKGKRMDKTFTLCGTPEYLSPELVGNRGHDKSVDYWAIGILIFELMTGQTPFADDSQAQTFQMILSSNAFLQFPPGFDFSCEDLVRKLLAPNPAKRLGNLRRGAADIRRHRWFRSLDWEGLKARAVESPYKPMIADPLDTSNFDEYPEDDEFTPYTDKGKGYFDKF